MQKTEVPAPAFTSIPDYVGGGHERGVPPCGGCVAGKIAPAGDIAGRRAVDHVIHIVDDDDAVRRSVAFMLKHAGFRTKSYCSGMDFLERAGTVESGSILLDICMPEMSGLEVLRELNERCNTSPVIVLTGSGEIGKAVQAMRAGATNFIEKPYEKETLLDAIHEATAQDDSDRSANANDARPRFASLSGHERDVLDRLLAGSPNTLIAQDLNLALLDVTIHRANAMEKLRVRSFAQALHLLFAAEDCQRKVVEDCS
jgi:two-component system, LuxR family, response regulator FixJ